MIHSIVRSKKGGAAIFLCIILSAVILVESVLFEAARQRSFEAELQKCMRLQTAQILCNYNDALLEYYGLYAVDSGSMNQTIFDTCYKESAKTNVTIEPMTDLTSGNMKDGIVDFMKLRFPAIATNEILTRLKSVLTEMKGNDIVKNAMGADSSAWLGYIKDYLTGKDTWSAILSNVASFVSVIDYSGKLGDLEAFASKYRAIAEQKSTQYLQGEADTSFKDNILKPDTLSGMMAYADDLLNYDLPDIADALLINQYALSFFDSSLETVKDGDSNISEKNILGTPYSEIHTGNQADLEYLLSGIDNDTVSSGAATILIFNVRTLLNFGAFILDKEKTELAQGIAEIMCIVIAVISVGTVVVDPTVLKFIILFVMAVGQSVSDISKLMNGESITFFNHSSITDQDTIEELLMTDYRDYVGFFLLFVPVDWKLSRMLTIMKRDCGNDLYTGVQITVDYNDSTFRLEDIYDAYV